jgi:hypothetical protein
LGNEETVSFCEDCNAAREAVEEEDEVDEEDEEGEVGREWEWVSVFLAPESNLGGARKVDWTFDIADCLTTEESISTIRGGFRTS